MQEDLQYLLQLSAVDKRVYALKQTKKDLPLRIQSLKDAIGTEKANLERIQTEITDTQAKIRENQDVIATETLSLQESSKRLENISTNREYDAVHLEIATHRKNMDTAQAHVLHFQQILENLQKDVEQVETQYKQVLEANEPELNKLVDELGGIEDRIAEQSTLADEPRRKIGKKVLSLYDRVVQRRNSPHVIAAVNQQHRHCEVCNRTQTPPRISEIATRSSLLTCESCGSILVWREE
jgi:predicted  nucleic acid-binding Zn-ribbon protein